VLNQGFLKHNRLLGEQLVQQSQLKPKGGKGKRPLLFSLTLTSLIDAFSILVIFLLTNANNTGQPLDFRGRLQLPLSQQSEALGMGAVIKVVEGRYFINNKEVSASEIPRELYQIKQSMVKAEIVDSSDALIVQADRHLEYASLSPIILAASHAGFEKFKFAVLPNGDIIK
jgi:biopolymer transport protein ExbD